MQSDVNIQIAFVHLLFFVAHSLQHSKMKHKNLKILIQTENNNDEVYLGQVIMLSCLAASNRI